jgi:hypothetical protein
MGETRTVCAQADCPVHHPKKQTGTHEPKWNAEEQKRRREEALAQATGLRTLAAIVAAVPVRLMKRDLLFVVEQLATLLDERRLEIVARQRGIKKAKDSDSIGKLFTAYLRHAEESALGGLLVEITIPTRGHQAERRTGTPRSHHRVQGGRGRHQPQGQAGVRREGESQAGAEAGSEDRAAKGQKSGLRPGINSGVCFGRPHFFVRPSSHPEGRSRRLERHDLPTRRA